MTSLEKNSSPNSKNSLEWLSEFLECDRKTDKRSCVLITGRPTWAPRTIVAVKHPEFGHCVVRIAEGESAPFLRNELSTIQICHDLTPSASVPKILHSVDATSWVAVVIPWYKKTNRLNLSEAANLISTIHLVTDNRLLLRDTTVFNEVQSWKTDLGISSYVIDKTLDLVSTITTPIQVGLTHRDFWRDNILADSDGYVIIDWEYSRPDYPVIFDIFAYYVWLGDTAEDRIIRVSNLIKSPRTAISRSIALEYLESIDDAELKIIVGIWLADDIGKRVTLACKTGLSEESTLEGWAWLDLWNTLVNGRR